MTHTTKRPESHELGQKVEGGQDPCARRKTSGIWGAHAFFAFGTVPPM